LLCRESAKENPGWKKLRSLRVRVGVTRLRLGVISRATLADLKLLMTDRDSIEVWEAPGVHYVDASAVLHDCGGSYKEDATINS